MNKIEAFIRPEKVRPVRDALVAAGFTGLNLVHVTGRGTETAERSADRGTRSYIERMLPRVKLELVVSDSNTDRALFAIMDSARTGNIGDGKVFVIPVAHAIRIRTGEEGDRAFLDRSRQESGDLAAVLA